MKNNNENNDKKRYEEIPIEEVENVDVGDYFELIKSKRKNTIAYKSMEDSKKQEDKKQ